MNTTMNTAALTVLPPDDGGLELAPTPMDGLERAGELARRSLSQNTAKAYKGDVDHWLSYCAAHGFEPWPVHWQTLAAYIGHLELTGRAASTILRRVSALATWHDQAGLVPASKHPEIKDLLIGLRKAHRGRRSKKRAFSGDLVREFVTHASTSARDRALAAVAFVTGLRAAELVELRWTDLDFCPVSSGFTIHVRFSKTDKFGDGAVVAVPRGTGESCPVRLLEAWRREATDPRIFPITTKTVLRVAKRVAELAGLDPSCYGAHSFRSGMCTTASRAGVSLAESMQASRHKSADVAAGYVQATQAGQNRAHRAAVAALTKTD